MITLLAWLPLALPAVDPRPASADFGAALADADLDAKLAEAGRDVAKLLALAESLTKPGQEADAAKVYRRVLEVDASNEAAHKALHHQLYDGKWFDSFAELAKFKREEAARMKAKGLVRWKEEWVAEGDLPFLKMAWTKDAQGAWVDPADAQREKEAAEAKAAGREFRPDDNSWVAPEDLEKWKALQWKCGDAWVDIAKANEFHSKIDEAWELVGEHFLVNATCEWEGGNFARWHADNTWPELVRIFGVEPPRRPQIFVLNSLAQYNQAAGNQPILIESEGVSSLHGAYFADAVFDFDAKPPHFQGCGVSYWDRKDPKLASWGPYWIRWAAAQSFVDGIDPSWNAVADRIFDGGKGDLAAYSTAFWGEKRIPRWLRYGAAAYVERFMKDPETKQGGDPWVLRTFACSEIKKAGGLHKLDDVFAFVLDVKDVPNSSRLYAESGLLVAYLLDGAPNDKELAEKHAAFRTALEAKNRSEIATAATALQKALAKHERDIKKFAGL